MTALLYVVLVALGVNAAGSAVRTASGLVGGALLWVAVAVPSLVELAVPAWEDVVERDPDRIADGEWWRLVTSAFGQDGGPAGTAFNLVVLAVVAVACGPVWGGVRLWLLFLGGAVAGNLLDVATLGSTGAGNSMATFAVAAATVALAARRAPGPAALVRLGLLVAACATLLALEDHHGFALVGALAVLLPERALPPPPTAARRSTP